MPHRLSFGFAILLCLVTASALPSTAQQPAQHKLELDRLYSLPSIIGTRPEAPTWSPDSRQLAFLWNDAGMPFLDLWTVAMPAGKPVRLTSMPHPDAPLNPGTDIAKLEQQARFEIDRGISAVAYTADSQHLVFLLHGQLFLLTPGQAPRRLAAELPAITEVLPAPAGGSLALITAAGELYLLDPAAAPVKVYAPTQPATSAEDVHWSPDATHLAFLEADRSHMPLRGIPDYLTPETTLHEVRRPFPGEPAERYRLAIVAASGGAVAYPELGGDPQDLFHGVTWSPDSKSLLVDRSDLYIKDRRLSLVDAGTGRPTLLVEERDPKNVTAEWWSAFTPDGRAILYTSDLAATDYQVFTKPLTAAAPTALTHGNFAVFSAELKAGALTLTTNQGRTEERQIFTLPAGGGSLRQLTTAPGTHTAITSPDGRYLADIFSDDLTPPDLYLQATTPGGEPRQLTHSPLPEFAQYHWVAARYVDFPNVHDGTNLHARLTLPPGFDPHKRYPAILGSVYSNTVHNQWGGRIFHPTWGLDQYLAQQGYVIINTDISGSSGYGKAFRQRLAQDYGGIDVDDEFSTAQYLIHTGYVDPARIGIWGSSYGGLLTTTSLFTHPAVFQAGIAGAPATSLFHALTGEMRTMMAPQGNEALYTKSSAFLKSGGLEDHLMLLQGMRDQVVLFKDSVTLTERLILQGKDVSLVPLPNAPHGWDTEGLAQTRYAYKKLVDYFARYLHPGT